MQEHKVWKIGALLLCVILAVMAFAVHDLRTDLDRMCRMGEDRREQVHSVNVAQRRDLDVLKENQQWLDKSHLAHMELTQATTKALRAVTETGQDTDLRHERRLGMLEYEPDYQAMVDATVWLKMGGGHGSGVFIHDNVILTAKHCADMPGDIIVEYQGKEYQVLARYLDPDSDLAMLLTEEIQEICIAEMMTPDQLHLGDTVFAVGTPLEDVWHLNLTKGIISHMDRGAIFGQYMPDWTVLIGYDAYGAPGCSGGPVYFEGRLMGICVTGSSRDGSGIVACVPVSELN